VAHHSQEYLLLEEVYRMPIKMETDWSLESKVAASRVFFAMLSGRTLGFPEITELVFVQRYRDLLRSGSVALELSSESAAIISQECEFAVDAVQQAHFENHMRENVEQLVERFAQMEDRAIREICLGNYVERVLEAMLGVHNTAVFLRDC
jgi:hypothetical protein